MTVSAEHRQRMLANLEEVVKAGNIAGFLTAAQSKDDLMEAWFKYADNTEGEPRRVLQQAYYRRLAELTGALVP